MSISRPAGMPSTVMTSAWPCDSPALRNLSIPRHFNTEDSAGPGCAPQRWPHLAPGRARCIRTGVSLLPERASREPERLHVPTSRLASLSPAVAEHVNRARRAEVFVRQGRHAAAERLLRDVAAALARRQAKEPGARVSIEL